ARVIGNEFLVACDIRFTVNSSAVELAQIEVSFGFSTGAGGALFVAHEIRRGRTLEYILSAKEVDAAPAAQISWINKVFDT
ncbi:hypothetical protein K438DRAFT_1423060, partial [Mycena galopus ATCC 62051]